MRPRFRIFESTMRSWERLLSDAAEFATEVGVERLMNICHSEDHNHGVVVVWYKDREALFRDSGMQVCFEVFRSCFSSWSTLLEESASFASTLAPNRLIGISHSEDKNDGVVVVWYWAVEG